MREDYPILYRVDSNDVITFVNEAWSRFATENQAHELASSALGRSLWDFIENPEVKSIYRMLLDRIRRTGQPFSFDYRCDAPELRRFLQMTVVPLDRGAVEFQSRLLREEPRGTVALLSSEVPRVETFVRVCSWCKKLDAGRDHWVEVEEALPSLGIMNKTKLPRLTHGACPQCYERMMAEIQNRP